MMYESLKRAMKETPPLCKNCKKALRRYCQSVYVPIDDVRGLGDEVPSGTRLDWTSESRKDVTKNTGIILSKKRRETFKSISFGVWFGNYGGYGDNRFCTLTCGWRWAIAHSMPSPIPERNSDQC